MIRLFEYDAQIALDEGVVTKETLTVTFPNTAVLYLRAYKRTPDKLKYVINTPGGTVQYDVPIMKIQTYSLDELEHQGVIGAFDKRTIIELSGDVIREIAKEYENVQKGAWNSNMNHALFCV